jgi:hypothetical protein|tara:strand:+ start:352 stop:522 length:171 start_codon:yes stop_codon:yes gene_type:complete
MQKYFCDKCEQEAPDNQRFHLEVIDRNVRAPAKYADVDLCAICFAETLPFAEFEEE